MASTRGPPRGVVGPELWPVGGIDSPIRPYHFLPPRGLLSSVMSGGHIIFAPKDEEILAYSARNLVGVLVVAPGPCGSVGWCSKS